MPPLFYRNCVHPLRKDCYYSIDIPVQKVKEGFIPVIN